MGDYRSELAKRRAPARANGGKRRRRRASLILLLALALVAIGITSVGKHADNLYSLLTGAFRRDGRPGPGENQLPGQGPDRFTFDGSTGPVLGGGGQVKRFRVAVEPSLNTDLGELSRMSDATLADRRGWTFDNKQGFQRVPGDAPSDFTIALVTRDTAFRMCERAGLDIREGGVPYTSCQANGWVVINLDRWLLSTPDYVNSGTPLVTYRQYVINHEIGHQLGLEHEHCPGAGQLAPVMQQQTLGLDGCVANPWPYPNAAT